MSFAESCNDIRLEDGYWLVAMAETVDGSWVESRINLNDFIGNEDGWFMWDGVNFAESANDIRLEGTLLTAELPMRDGGYRERQGIELNDRIRNLSGMLIFE
ncbi:Cyanovirin-N [Aspergillus karnatakaensis]|uniref:CVNH domain-containing protein n=1 Tax=Aspergillus karnatakaensis TaxID=1810916 RepID=UPI003CCDFEA1